jgi:hypothetical protein
LKSHLDLMVVQSLLLFQTVCFTNFVEIINNCRDSFLWVLSLNFQEKHKFFGLGILWAVQWCFFPFINFFIKVTAPSWTILVHFTSLWIFSVWSIYILSPKVCLLFRNFVYTSSSHALFCYVPLEWKSDALVMMSYLLMPLNSIYILPLKLVM